MNKTLNDDIINKLVKKYENQEFETILIDIQKFVKEYPDSFILWKIMGATHLSLKQFEDAENCFLKGAKLNKNDSKIFSNLGVVYKEQKRFKKSIEYYLKSISMDPNDANTHFNLGNSYKSNADFFNAIKSYKNAININPKFHIAYNNMGNALQEIGKPKEAIKSFLQAIRFKPNYSEAYNNLGVIYKKNGNLNYAQEAFLNAIKLDFNHSRAHFNLAKVYEDRGQLDMAIKSYTKSFEINPEFSQAYVSKLFLLANTSDFRAFSLFNKVKNKIGIAGQHVTPFSLLFAEDNPLNQQLRSKNWVKNNYFKTTKNIVCKNLSHKKIPIAYFSADFHDHPVSHLLCRVLELHNREDFEVHAFSYGIEKKDYMRNRIINSVDFFHDVKNLNDEKILNEVKKFNIQIAIDLTGYTNDARTELFSKRLAPIQINYLGFPSTMGTNFIDYIIADKIVIDEKFREFYSEKIINMPHSFMPTDNTRKISSKRINKRQFGLPDSSFVFCCFNNNYKIDPTVFSIWIRLLKNIKNSVLWLRKTNEWATKNLQNEVQKHGVDAKRLIFAEKVDMEVHLARHRLADLFLDTFNYNAHTTACEALWSGLPVITKVGKQFSARVGASLLDSIGLPELITHNSNDYEKKIFYYASDPKKLLDLKKKLHKKIKTSHLFNSEKYTKDLENLLKKIYKSKVI